jgi:hypothetical protein
MFKAEAGKDGRSKSLATNMVQDTDLVIEQLLGVGTVEVQVAD